MTDHPPRLLLGVVRLITLVRLLLMCLPLVPGLIFFAVGFFNDPLWPAQDPTPQMEVSYARDRTRSDQIYQAAAVTFAAGTLGSMAVLWKIVRTRPEDPDKQDSAVSTFH